MIPPAASLVKSSDQPFLLVLQAALLLPQMRELPLDSRSWSFTSETIRPSLSARDVMTDHSASHDETPSMNCVKSSSLVK